MKSNHLGRISAVVFVGGLAAIALGGCTVKTETDPDNTPAYKYATESSFCAAVAEAECNDAVVKACYGSDDASIADDRKSCAEVRGASDRCNPDALPYHPEKAEACVSARAAALKDAAITKDDLKKVADACLPVFSKDGKEGTTCSADTDCATGDGYRCVAKADKSTCVVPREITGGSKCSDPDAVCVEGFHCDEGGHCVEDSGEGDACDDVTPCTSDLRCGMATNTCIAKTANGDTCATADECKGGFCIKSTGSSGNGACSATDQLAITSASCAAFK